MYVGSRLILKKQKTDPNPTFFGDTLYYLLVFLLRVDIIVGKHQVADGEGEDGNWYGDTVEEGAGNLPVVQLGDHSPRLQTGVETREVETLLAEGF